MLANPTPGRGTLRCNGEVVASTDDVAALTGGYEYVVGVVEETIGRALNDGEVVITGSIVPPQPCAGGSALGGGDRRARRACRALDSPVGLQSFARLVRGSEMALHTYGTMGVDWEERVRFDRLREERLARIKAELAASDMGALLCFDMTNIRYITATHIGTWAQDKLNRFCLLPQRRRADHVGLRLRRPPSRDLLPVAG